MSALAATALAVVRRGAHLIEAIEFDAAGGAFIGLVGPNGAGKTTLLRTLAGLERPNAGAVMIDGAPLAALGPGARARRISYLPQAREVAWEISAEAVAALGRFAYGAPHRLGSADRAAIDRAFAACGADAFRSRTMSTLSGGEQARVHLARALAAETPILLADEPTAALDLKHARDIMKALRAKADAGGLVIAALHDLALAQRWCTRLLVMHRGRIAADGPPETAITPQLLEDIFGVQSIAP